MTSWERFKRFILGRKSRVEQVELMKVDGEVIVEESREMKVPIHEDIRGEMVITKFNPPIGILMKKDERFDLRVELEFEE